MKALALGRRWFSGFSAGGIHLVVGWRRRRCACGAEVPPAEPGAGSPEGLVAPPAAVEVALATPPGPLHIRIEAAIRYAARFTSARAAIEVLGLIARDQPEAAGSRLAAHERTFGRVPILVALRRRMPSIVRDKRR